MNLPTFLVIASCLALGSGGCTADSCVNPVIFGCFDVGSLLTFAFFGSGLSSSSCKSLCSLSRWARRFVVLSKESQNMRIGWGFLID